MNDFAAATADRLPGLVLALCGGVGGAKLALGLYHVVAPGQLVVAVNTGDDFEHLGLSISPDIDTVLYTLGGIADPVRGWGRANETWNFMATLGELGGETWFRLGDRDLAMHVARTNLLKSGRPLSEFVSRAAKAFGIDAEIVPMSDDRLRTIVSTPEGELPFQHYFVARQCAPVVKALRYDGAEHARPAARLIEALMDPTLRAVIICPSNPYLSIDPFLAMPMLRRALARSKIPVIAVSPIIAGKAVKGPTSKIMAELDIPATNQSIAAHYRGIIDGLVVDMGDTQETRGIDIPVRATPILMKNLADSKRLAREVMVFADEIAALNPATANRKASAFSHNTERELS